MKKIMFQDKFGLTKAVLEGRKTQTRRLVGLEVFSRVSLIAKIINRIFKKESQEYFFECEGEVCKLPKNKYPKYEVGEIVAVAQRYETIRMEKWRYDYNKAYEKILRDPSQAVDKGFGNKMFVKAEYMPHQIKIINVRLERLQDITDGDCIDEGVKKSRNIGYYVEGIYPNKQNGSYTCTDECKTFRLFPNPREAYAALIDKISGKGTWNKNPWVWVYEFELVK